MRFQCDYASYSKKSAEGVPRIIGKWGRGGGLIEIEKLGSGCIKFSVPHHPKFFNHIAPRQMK